MAFLKQSIDKASEEDLLKILEGDTSVEQAYDFDNDVDIFLSLFTITPGDNLLSVKIFYELYYKWSKNPIHRNDFPKKVGKYLPITTSKGNLFFSISALPIFLKNKVLAHIASRINTPNKLTSPIHKRHFDNFLSFYKIKRGRYYIQAYVLYYLYDKWTFKTKTKNTLGYKYLINFLKLYFPNKMKAKHGTSVYWFAVHKSILEHITTTEINEIIQGYQYQYGNKTKKTTKKVEKGISSIPESNSTTKSKV